jgi:hypothetical protein
MADRFEKFTEHARSVLTYAQEEAQRFNHNYLGTEHLLLGLVREGDGVAAKVLINLGVELGKVRSAVEFIIGRGERSPRGEIGLTPRAKKVIELSVAEARHLDHSYVGTEHLLLGLVGEAEGIAFGVLQSLDVSLERVRTETARVLSNTPPASHAVKPSDVQVAEARHALEEAIAAIEAPGISDLPAELARAVLVPMLREIIGGLGILGLGYVSEELSVRRQLHRNLQILDDAAAVFNRHHLEDPASLLLDASAAVRVALG